MNYIIGDIHGCFYTLKNLILKIKAEDSDAKFIFVGDYIDRGLWSNKVIDFMIDLQNEGAVCLRGNHDDVVGWLLNNQSLSDLREFVCGAVTHISVMSWWLVNGLFPTIRAYVADATYPSEELLHRFIESVPKSHKDFINGLAPYWENDTHFACHGFLNPSQELPRKLDFLKINYNDMLWSRFQTNFVDIPYGRQPSGVGGPLPVWDKIGVFGHTPVTHYGSSSPIKYGNLRLIDTGSFLKSGLTAYCCEQDNFIVQETDSKDIR